MLMPFAVTPADHVVSVAPCSNEKIPTVVIVNISVLRAATTLRGHSITRMGERRTRSTRSAGL